MDEYSIENTHEALKQRLIDYVETAYFGKNDELRKLCRTELEAQGAVSYTHLTLPTIYSV